MITDKAMIVRLSISQWTARRLDKAVSRKAADAAKASRDAGRFNKLLISADALRDIGAMVASARTYYHENTLPWDDFGGRLLPSADFTVYSREMRERKAAFEAAVRRFVEAYPVICGEARKRLGDMYCAADYPPAEQIARKFSFSAYIDPVPVAGDFRVSLAQDDADEIKSDIESRLADRLRMATRDLFSRVERVLSPVVAKLRSPDAIFRDSLIRNVSDLVEALPRLNLTDDPDIAELCVEMREKVASWSPQTLRNSPEARKRAHDGAQAVLDKMSGFVGAA